MSHKEKMAELRQHLESWKHSVDVHSSHAHEALYEFLNKLLKLGENEPEKAPEEPEQVQSSANDDPPGEGGNSPEGTPDLP